MKEILEEIIDAIDIALKKYGFGVDEYRLDKEGNLHLTIIPLVLRKPQRKGFVPHLKEVK